MLCCCSPEQQECLLLPRAIASLAWTGGGAPSLHNFRGFQPATACSESLSDQNNDYRSLAFVEPTFLPFI